jgi:hypothetical protein
MPLETVALKVAADTTEATLRIGETAVKKAWSILDAATEKKSPGEILSSKAIQAIQGKPR